MCSIKDARSNSAFAHDATEVPAAAAFARSGLRPQSILESLNRGGDRQIAGFTETVWQQFREYNWPGNVDELAAVVQEARTACASEAAGNLVEQNHLPFRFRTGLDAQTVGPATPPVSTPLEPLLERVEREQIERALWQSRGNKSAAAKLLDVSRQKLYHRMEALGIEDAEDSQFGV